MIEQATVHLPRADRDTNLPVALYLAPLSSEECPPLNRQTPQKATLRLWFKTNFQKAD